MTPLEQRAKKIAKSFYFSKSDEANVYEALLAFAEQVRRETVEEAAVANCGYCRDADWPLCGDNETHRNAHRYGQGRITAGHAYRACDSIAIRALLAPPAESSKEEK